MSECENELFVFVLARSLADACGLVNPALAGPWHE